jgi:hypothetical protein
VQAKLSSPSMGEVVAKRPEGVESVAMKKFVSGGAILKTTPLSQLASAFALRASADKSLADSSPIEGEQGALVPSP